LTNEQFGGDAPVVEGLSVEFDSEVVTGSVQSRLDVFAQVESRAMHAPCDPWGNAG